LTGRYVNTMRALLSVLVGFVLDAQTIDSPFNSYKVFLEPARMTGGCSVANAEQFGNRAYLFRGWRHSRTPLVLRNGKAIELNVLGRPEWESELVRHAVVSVGGQPAVLLRFFENHVGGTGSWGTVLIGTCDDRRLTIVFEAESQGLGEIVFTANEELVVGRAVWLRSDAHCCPSG
jgi:hypothetical protein